MTQEQSMSNQSKKVDKVPRKLQFAGVRKAISGLRLFPKNHDFFGYYQRSGENIVKGTKLLCQMIANRETRYDEVKNLKAIEEAGDEITHDVIDLLHHTFLTPFDRADMHTLIVKMDDVLDFANYVGNRLTRYDVKFIPKEMTKLADILHRASQEIAIAVFGLKNLKDSQKILDQCVKIKDLENEADEQMNSAIEHIFHSGLEPLEVIKVKELLENLEGAVDKCEGVANIIEGIILKHV